MKALYIYLSFIFLVFLFSSNILAVSPVVLQPDKKIYSIGGHLKIFEDRDENREAGDVGSKLMAEKFISNLYEALRLGSSSSTYWLRFQIDNHSLEKEWLLELEFPIVDMAELYVPQSSGQYLAKKTGNISSFSQRDVKHRHFVFKLSIPLQSSSIFYLKIKSKNIYEVLSAPLTLRTQKAFIAKAEKEYCFLGIYYGIMLAMFFYNLFLFFSLKDRENYSYLYYALFIACLGLVTFGLNGLSYQYFIPNWTGGQYQITFCLTGATIVFQIQFIA